MYEIRQVIQRLFRARSDRDVACAQRVGRKTVARVRRQAFERGWLDPKTPLPEDRELAEVFASAPTNRSVSSAAPFREQILAWHGQGITATAIHQALVRKYRFTGSVHTIYRLLDRVVDSSPPATVILDFAVAEAAQVDFGQGPQIIDRATGEVMKTWFFVMTLAWSRHQYAELVRNQKVKTWLACHRHAFEWFNLKPQLTSPPSRTKLIPAPVCGDCDERGGLPQGYAKRKALKAQKPVAVDTFGGRVHVEWDPAAAVTPLGQLPFFIDFLKVSGVFDAWVKDCPLHYVSNNASDKRAVLATFLLSILAGHHRLLCTQGDAHITGLREDSIHPELLGVDKLVSEDAARRALARIDESAGWAWFNRQHGRPCHQPVESVCAPR